VLSTISISLLKGTSTGVKMTREVTEAGRLASRTSMGVKIEEKTEGGEGGRLTLALALARSMAPKMMMVTQATMQLMI